MTEEKKHNSGADYKYLALKPETYNRLTRLMPGKRHYDNLVNLCIDAYVMSGGVCNPDIRSGIIHSAPGEILKCVFKPELFIKIMLDENDKILFSLTDIASVLSFGKKLGVYIENKPELYTGHYSIIADRIWIDVEGLCILFAEYKKNIPRASRSIVFHDVYTLLCWCEQFRPASTALELHSADEVFS